LAAWRAPVSLADCNKNKNLNHTQKVVKTQSEEVIVLKKFPSPKKVYKIDLAFLRPNNHR